MSLIIDVNLDHILQCEIAGMAWMTAAEALAALGVKPQTLYASVSRGRIASKPDLKDPRRSLYNAGDVARLAAKPRGAPRSTTVAAQSLTWGEPVLTTAISTVDRGRLFYRGVDAVALSRDSDVEGAAALLWGGDCAELGDASTLEMRAGDGPRLRLFQTLGSRAALDPPSLGRSSAILRREAAAILDSVFAAVTGEAEGPAHQRLARAWSCPPEPLRRALVLLADHELNASAFAARVALSTGASLAAGALAGLATLTGPRHGGAGLALRALGVEAAEVGPEAAIRSWLAQGRSIPGFGHPLYPDGDVRATAILAEFETPDRWNALAAAAEAQIGEAPNVDFALAVLTDRFALPDDAPFLLFALARTVGWLAHGLEQAAQGALIRPRARYVGPSPASFTPAAETRPPG